jgi:hypothetical protein
VEDGSRVQILKQVTEDEVLECFVRAERDSSRYGEAVRKLERRVGDNPRAILSAYRAWPDEGLFGGFPHDVRWCLARLTRDELLEIRYINWDWWLRISGGTRRPREAAARSQADDGDERIARAAATNPPLIAVRAPDSYLVLLEGHVRLTAYALFPEYLPPALEIYLGESPRMARWSLY